MERFQLDCVAAAVDVPCGRYMDWAFDGLGRLLRFDRAGWAIGTRDPPAINAIHLRGPSPALVPAYREAGFGLDYMALAAAATPGVTMNAIAARTAFAALVLAFDALVSEPFGLRQGLTTLVPHGGDSPLGHLVMLWRTAADDPFTEDERVLVQHCVPHMVAGWRAAQALDLAQRSVRPDTGRALVDARGALHSFDCAFVRLVRTIAPDWADSRLPPALLSAMAGGPTPPGLAIATEPQPPLIRLTLVQQARLPLTPAQARAARLYAEGLDHRTIAARLGLAPATVRNQIAAAYRRLGVGDKAALARRLTRA